MACRGALELFHSPHTLGGEGTRLKTMVVFPGLNHYAALGGDEEKLGFAGPRWCVQFTHALSLLYQVQPLSLVTLPPNTELGCSSTLT